MSAPAEPPKFNPALVFGKAGASITVTSMQSDEWLEMMLDILDEKERRTGVKIVDPYPDDY